MHVLKSIFILSLLIVLSACGGRSWMNEDVKSFVIEDGKLKILLSQFETTVTSSWLAHHASYRDAHYNFHALEYALPPNDKVPSAVLLASYERDSALVSFLSGTTLLRGESARHAVAFSSFDIQGVQQKQWTALDPDSAPDLPGYTYLIAARDNRHFLHGAKIYRTQDGSLVHDLTEGKSFVEFLAKTPELLGVSTSSQSNYRLTEDLRYVVYLRGLLLPSSSASVPAAVVYDRIEDSYFTVSLPLADFDVRARVFDVANRADKLQFLMQYTSKKHPDTKININAEHKIEKRYRYQIVDAATAKVDELPWLDDVFIGKPRESLFWDGAGQRLHILDDRNMSGRGRQMTLTTLLLDEKKVLKQSLPLPALSYAEKR